MKLLLITDEYIPTPSSNGACVHKLVQSLPQEHSAYVLSVTREERENTDRIRYATYHRTPVSLKNRLFGYCQDDGFVKIICEQASQWMKEEDFDTVVCLCRPIEPMIAGLQLKKRFPKLRLIGYFLDNVFETHLSNQLKTKIVTSNYTRLFRRFYREADRLIILKYYKETFSRLFPNSDKVVYVGLPSLLPTPLAKPMGGEGIRIVYTGSLCRGYREPQGVLKLLGEVWKINPNFFVEFYSRGCEDQLGEAKKIFGDHLIDHGLVPFEEAQKQIASADVLLNIANDLPYAVPGKLFEYFSTGKPILNFQFRADDPAGEEYEKYPKMFTLYAYRENDVAACAEFLFSAHEQIPLEELRRLYLDSTPSFTIEKMIEIGEKKDV